MNNEIFYRHRNTRQKSMRAFVYQLPELERSLVENTKQLLRIRENVMQPFYNMQRQGTLPHPLTNETFKSREDYEEWKQHHEERHQRMIQWHAAISEVAGPISRGLVVAPSQFRDDLYAARELKSSDLDAAVKRELMQGFHRVVRDVVIGKIIPSRDIPLLSSGCVFAVLARA